MIPTMFYVCFVAVVVITVYALNQTPALTLVDDVRVSKAEDDEWIDKMNAETARIKADAEKAELIDRIKKAAVKAEADRAAASAVEAARNAEVEQAAEAEAKAARAAAEAADAKASRPQTSVLKTLSIRNRRVQAVKRADAKKALANFASMYEGRLRPRC
jgi:hypothetical protein